VKGGKEGDGGDGGEEGEGEEEGRAIINERDNN
jgi:hypothetical protein